MKLEGIVCPECNEPLKEEELAKSLVCPKCRTNLKNRKYLDFVEFLMTQGIVTDMDFFDQALYGADAVFEQDIEAQDETDPNEFERIERQIRNLDEDIELNEVTTDEEEFRQWEGLEDDWEEFNRRQDIRDSE
ncbi:MAG: hypothetical protein IIB43_01165 [Candidatus Marinimicrobia bacterium]|nr:hypothetical protein [Candidatus Neomarinimicrobiota bacterium]